MPRDKVYVVCEDMCLEEGLTKDQVADLVRETASSEIAFKGDVATLDDLPDSADLNDTYYVQSENCRYTWTGTEFKQSSPDESAYSETLNEIESSVDDIQDEISTARGTHETLNARFNASDAIDATLTANVNAVTNAVVDTTGNQFYQLTSGSYINISLTTQIQTLTPVSSSSYGHIIIDCVAGDKFTITGEGGGSSSGGAILWTFINSSNQIISHAAAGATVSDLELTAPINAVKLIVNSKAAVSIICKGRLLKNKLGEIDESHTNADGITFESLNARLNATDAYIESEFDAVDEKILDITGNKFYSLTAGAYINISTSTSTVNLTPQISTGGFGYAIIDCNEFDTFVVTGQGGGNSAGGAILWAFLDSSNKWINHAAIGLTVSNLELTAPINAVKLIVNSKAAITVICKNKLVKDKITEIDSDKGIIKSYVANTNAYNFVHGGLNSSGTASTRTDTIISPFIKCLKGSEITVDENYVFAVAEYSAASDSTKTAYRTLSGVKYTVVNDGYIRVTVRKKTDPQTIVNIPYMAMHLHLVIVSEKIDNLLASGFSQSLYDRRDISDLSNKINGWYKCVTQTATDFDADTTYSEFISAFDTLVSTAPNYITKSEAGISSDDRSIPLYTLKPIYADNAYAKKPPKVLIIGCQHGFEKGPSFGIYYFVRDLLNSWSTEPILEYIKDHVELKIIPIVNPNGYDNQEYKNANGVNINRNYDCNWTLVADTSSSEYGGAEPFDQPESQMIRSFVNANKDAVLFIDYHNLGRTGAQSSARIIDHNLPEITDVYAKRLYTAAIYHHRQCCSHFKKDYLYLSDDIGYSLGKCEKAVGTGLSKSWVSNQGILGTTLEIVPGWSAGSEFVESNKRATAEFLVNFVVSVLNHLD